MPDDTARSPAPKRRRGRPRGASDARARILDAAQHEFAERGYDGATMRAIAAHAGVDSALLHHYFGTKADLFTACADLPVRPDREIGRLLAGPREAVGPGLVRFVLVAMEDDATRRRALTVLRASLGNRLATPLLVGFLRRELIGRLMTGIDGPDAELRASLVAAQMAGLLIGRYVAELPGLTNASIDELVERIGPTIHRYLFG